MLNKFRVLSIHNQFPSPVALKHGLYGGVGYYRQRMPAKYLSKHGFAFLHIGKELVNISSDEMEKKIAEYVKNSDIVYTKHLDNPYAVSTLLGVCDFYKKALIVDFDDHVLATDNMSPDKYTYEKGGDHYHYLKTLLSYCTAITVSTKPLVDVYRQFNERIHLLPNACDMKDWKHEKRAHDRITVGWAGSASHAVDHPLLEPVYGKVIEKHPDVVFSFVGHMLPEHIKGMQRKNWEIKPGITWWEGNPESTMTYPRMLAEYGYDIGLAPLIPSQFNEARSLVKWFEYTMTGIPMVASEWGPYLDLEDGKDVYLVKTPEGWAQAINHLIEHEHDRKRLVENARKRIKREYSIAKTIGLWREVFSKYAGRGFKR